MVNLHFFLVFPRQNPVFLRHRRLVLSVLYGIPVVFLAAIWGSMFMSHWFRLYDSGDPNDGGGAGHPRRWRWATSRWRR